MQMFLVIGNLTRDPELSETKSGKSLCRFAIAVNRKFSSGVEKSADFFNCTAFSTQAESIAKYCRRGDKVFVRGSVQVHNYEDGQGITRTSIEILVDECEFVNLRKNNNEG